MAFGLGVYGAQFVQGGMAQADQMLGERQKIAQAFETFKAQNPSATYSDFRSFIDQMTNGDSYLAGAAPRDDILQKLGALGEQNARDEAARKSAAAMQAKLVEQDTINQGLRKGYEDGIREPDKLTEYLFKTFGITDPGTQQKLGEKLQGMNLPGWIDKQDREYGDRYIQETMPMISAGLLTTPEAIKARAPKFFTASPVFESTFGTLATGLDTVLTRKKQEAVQQAVSLAQAVGDDLDPSAFQQLAVGVYGGDAAHPGVQTLAKSLWTRAKQERAAVERERQLREQQVVDARNAAAEAKAAAMRNAALSNPVILRAAASGNQGRVSSLLQAYGIDRSILPDIMSSAPTVMSANQEQGYNERVAAGSAAIPKTVDSRFSQSTALLGSTFGPKSALGQKIPALVGAAQNLSQTHYFDGDDIAAIYDDVNARPGIYAKMTMAQIQAEMLKVTGGKVETRSQLYSSLADDVKNSGRPQTFESFVSDATRNVQQVSSGATAELGKIAALPPEQRQARVKSVLSQTRGALGETIVQLQQAGETKDQWLDPSGQPFNPSVIGGVVTNAQKEYQRVLAQAEKVLATPSPVSPTATPSPTSYRSDPTNPGMDIYRRKVIDPRQAEYDAVRRRLLSPGGKPVGTPGTGVLRNPNARNNFVTR